ncbi:AP2 domain-containing protein [Bradyrhizobium ottawaense]|uniref:AP2 domain-containing protein n=1 Tax=Bradyrhizobium ottawaense TaxID=931866 RepID=UPI0034E2BBD2
MFHREAIRAPRGLDVDHKDHNGLNNKRSNLRAVANGDNRKNSRIRRGGTSRFKGVYWRAHRKKWVARISVNGLAIHIGSFDCEEEAARAYDLEAIRCHGTFASLNFPPQVETAA